MSQAKRKKGFGVGSVKRQLAYLSMVLPGVIFLLLFSYLPMPGIILAFKNYMMKVPQAGSLVRNTFLYSLFTSEWNGIKNFTYLLKEAPMLLRKQRQMLTVTIKSLLRTHCIFSELL